MKLDWSDVEELAAAVLNLPDDWEGDDVTNELDQQLGVSFEQFQDIVQRLIEFTVPALAAISGTAFKGFVRDGAFIVKVPHNA